jgi:single-strand DNA-binding protein
MYDHNNTWVGNLTRDFELKFSDSGVAVARAGLAINRRVKDDTAPGGYRDGDPTFLNLVAFRQVGENAAASLPKGTRVIVIGRLDVRQYDKDDGTKGTAADVVVDAIGPDLTWATAEVTKNERKSTNGSGPSADADVETFA